MDAIRDVLKSGLKRSLGSLPQEDRLSAAWLVTCGPTLAEHGEIMSYSGGQLVVAVESGAWMEQFRSMRRELETELTRVAGLPVTGIHFHVKR